MEQIQTTGAATGLRGEDSMPLIEWDDSLSVHDAIMDEHHRNLVQLLNRTYDDFTGGKPADSLGAVIHELLDYATYHFATEERLMAESGYPDFHEHRDEHMRFVLKVARLQKSFQDGDRHLAFEIISFMKNWVTNHIRVNDVQCGEFLAGGKRNI